MRFAVPAVLAGMTAAVLAGVWHTAGVLPQSLPPGPPPGDLGGAVFAPTGGIAPASAAVWVFAGIAALILLAGLLSRRRPTAPDRRRATATPRPTAAPKQPRRQRATAPSHERKNA